MAGGRGAALQEQLFITREIEISPAVWSALPEASGYLPPPAPIFQMISVKTHRFIQRLHQQCNDCTRYEYYRSATLTVSSQQEQERNKKRTGIKKKKEKLF